MDIKQFLTRLSSDTPTPGGGSASAFAGALSASLISMVAGFSLKKGELTEKEAKEIRRKSLMIQKQLFMAVDRDAASYEGVLKAFRLPKNTEKDRTYRSRKIQKAYQKATTVPQLVCELSIRLLKYSEILILKGNPNAFSDAGVAAFLADAALSGGLINIKINLGPLKDKIFTRRMNSLNGQYAKKRDHFMRRILKALK